MNTFVYKLGNSLYINLTNRCTNRCTFCVRNKHDGMGEYNLWLDREPSAAEVIALIPDPTVYDEVVFCGFGEPTERIDVLLEIAGYLKKKGAKTRLNTNGHGSHIAGFDITPLLKDKIDTVSISLNADNSADYQKVCRCEFQDGFEEMLSFAVNAGKYTDVVVTIVDILPADEQERCKKLCAERGLKLRIREMIK